jgi:hypothetical protein
MSLDEVLTMIRSRPGIILGHKSPEILDAFLTGFTFATKDPDDLRFLSAFTDWVRRRYNIKSSQGWAKIINFPARIPRTGWTCSGSCSTNTVTGADGLRNRQASPGTAQDGRATQAVAMDVRGQHAKAKAKRAAKAGIEHPHPSCSQQEEEAT